MRRRQGGQGQTLAKPPMRRSNRVDVHTRSHEKVGSVPSSGLPLQLNALGHRSRSL